MGIPITVAKKTTMATGIQIIRMKPRPNDLRNESNTFFSAACTYLLAMRIRNNPVTIHARSKRDLITTLVVLKNPFFSLSSAFSLVHSVSPAI